MNYISHIKELVSGIIDNEIVTRDTEAYNALTALKNHLESLEEVYKYMPYKDPGPVIEKLEQSLARANTDRIRIRDLYVKESTSNFKINQDLKDAQAKIQELRKTIEDLNKENAHYRNILDQKNQDNKELEQLQSQITNLEEDLKKQTQTSSQKQEEISFLVGILSEEQLEEYQEYLRTQLPDDQPNYGPRHISRTHTRR